MHFEGNLDVFRQLRRKRSLLRKGSNRHQGIKPLLLILSGLMRGVSGGGTVTALGELGFANVFDNVIGVSTGAPMAAYFLAGMPEVGTSIYCDECTREAFFNLRRLKKVVDIDFLARVFRGESQKALDVDAVLKSRPGFFVGVTEVQSGEGLLVDAKAAPDLIEAIKASIAVPGLYPAWVALGGVLYTDGEAGLPFPSQLVIERFEPTDVLVIANRSPQGLSEPLERGVHQLFHRKLPPELQRAIATWRDRFLEGLQYLRASKVRWGILWADDTIRSFTRNRERLIAAAESAERFTRSLLGKYAPHRDGN